jgi:hypothetical protein
LAGVLETETFANVGAAQGDANVSVEPPGIAARKCKFLNVFRSYPKLQNVAATEIYPFRSIQGGIQRSSAGVSFRTHFLIAEAFA